MSIPNELKKLVFQSVKLLGLAIQDVYGQKLFLNIEELRLKMKGVRQKDSDVVFEAMEEVYQKLRKFETEDLHRVCKAFSLMLEIINASEAAYRTHRLQGLSAEFKVKPDSLVYVFTSHPTEARSKEFLFLTDRVEDLLVRALEIGFEEIREDLLFLLRMALMIPLANKQRPKVKDEAQQIFHTVLDERILAEQIALKKKGLDVYFRTWVGGDKDGHPKVGAETLLQSLTLSRQKLLHFMDKRLKQFELEMKWLDREDKKLNVLMKNLRSELRNLRVVKEGDGKKVLRFKSQFVRLKDLALDRKALSPVLTEISKLLSLYPALVMPMEIREDSGLIHESLKTPGPIAHMLKALKKVSLGLDPRFYVRGFIISMCQTPGDLGATVSLITKHFGYYAIPAVPLFENEKGLINSSEILDQTFKKYPVVEEHKMRWQGRLEVMLGYSDSSKENGVLPSRLLVQKALLELEETLQRQGLTPIFFHGSGGSTGRGGGSLKEQIAWWPKSALNVYKMTIQGETIQRHFHHAPILRSQVKKVADEFADFKEKKYQPSPIADQFAKLIQGSYRNLVQDPEFQTMTSVVTPYDFLDLLRIGSRPTKRSGKGKFTIRAIPWILCWTQTRLLLPIWWGVGDAWSKLSDAEKSDLKEYYQNSPLMQSYLKNLGFTLARIEMGVWEFHLCHSSLSDEQKNMWRDKIRSEFHLTIKFFQEINPKQDFTWFQPRLGESIYFRSSMIHPLNIIQKISLERKDHQLLRETVTGIACGMLTTG